MDYLRPVISENRIAVDPRKLKAIKEWPLPKGPKALRGFLGLTSYYRKFVRAYGAIATLLNHMLRKGGFKWTTKAQAAFEQLRGIDVTSHIGHA